MVSVVLVFLPKLGFSGLVLTSRLSRSRSMRRLKVSEKFVPPILPDMFEEVV